MFYIVSAVLIIYLLSFPTRRSSDLMEIAADARGTAGEVACASAGSDPESPSSSDSMRDRKSTRLNSSHRCMSYAVFCLKKKTLRSTTDGLTWTVMDSEKRGDELFSI